MDAPVVGSQPPMPLSTRTPMPGVCVMPSSTSAAAEPVWNMSGVGWPLFILPRLADDVNCTRVHCPGLVGGTLFGVGHDDGDGAGLITVGANTLETLAFFRLTRTGRNRFAFTTACGPLTGSLYTAGDSVPWVTKSWATPYPWTRPGIFTGYPVSSAALPLTAPPALAPRPSNASRNACTPAPAGPLPRIVSSRPTTMSGVPSPLMSMTAGVVTTLESCVCWLPAGTVPGGSSVLTGHPGTGWPFGRHAWTALSPAVWMMSSSLLGAMPSAASPFASRCASTGAAAV